MNALPVAELAHVVLRATAGTVGQPFGAGLRADIGGVGKPAETAGFTAPQWFLDDLFQTEQQGARPSAGLQPTGGRSERARPQGAPLKEQVIDDVHHPKA